MKKSSINELMGKSGDAAKSRKLSIKDLKDLLGERCPKIEYNPVGRLRLMSALRQRFGDGFRSLPGIDNIVKEFDDEAKFNVKLAEMRMVKPSGRKT